MNHVRALGFGRLRLQDGVKRLSKRMLMRAGRLIVGNPRVKRVFIRSASMLGLTSRLSRLYGMPQTATNGFHSGWPDAPKTIKQLGPHARHVYSDLRNAIKSQRKKQS